MHAGKLNHEYSNGYAKRQNIMTWGAFLTMEIGSFADGLTKKKSN